MAPDSDFYMSIFKETNRNCVWLDLSFETRIAPC